MNERTDSIPRFSKPMVDTHCHLDYLKQAPREEILALCRESGVEKMITIAVKPDNLSAVLQLAETTPEVYCTQGIHPHEAKDYSDQVEELIASRLDHEKVVAVGEVGLDYHYNHSPMETQKEVFRRQAALATAADMPLVVHSRDAEEDTMEILSEAEAEGARGVIHSFSSNLKLARFALDHNFLLGFNGIITFKKAENVREAVRLAPLDRILLETDAPFLTPAPFRGKENAPFYLPLIAAKVAEIKGVDVDEVLERTYQNSRALFGLSVESCR